KECPPASSKYFQTEVMYVPKQAELYQKQYDNLQALKEYTLKTGAFYLDEVTITEYKRKPDDGHFRIHSKPANSKKLTDRDVGYLSIFEYIQSHFAGVRITPQKTVILLGGPSSFTGGFLGEDAPKSGFEVPDGSIRNSGALLLLDGFPITPDMLASIPVSNIDVVEILRFAHEVGIYGTMAGNGVVAVYTKKVEHRTTQINICQVLSQRNLKAIQPIGSSTHQGTPRKTSALRGLTIGSFSTGIRIFLQRKEGLL
ncbi:MAG: hypothetical protein U9R60_17980, partial [Bacteroidota bacterium]|nr:hypothetical protein [Bacteroidota bacterium]